MVLLDRFRVQKKQTRSASEVEVSKEKSADVLVPYLQLDEDGSAKSGNTELSLLMI